MSQPIYKNEKPYSIAVPTPYGSSINIHPGFFIIGDYFNKFQRATMELTLKPEGTKVPDSKLVCTYTISKPKPAEVVVNETPVEKAPVNIENNPDPVSKNIAEPPVQKNKGGRPRKSLEEATTDLWKDVTFVMPSFNEVKNMTTEEVTTLATKLKVSPKLSRTEMIEAIKLKLG